MPTFAAVMAGGCVVKALLENATRSARRSWMRNRSVTDSPAGRAAPSTGEIHCATGKAPSFTLSKTRSFVTAGETLPWKSVAVATR